jgi:dCMP deaminase
LKRQYGSVIVKDDRIISTGYNGSPRGCKNCCDDGVCKRMNIPHNTDYSTCNAVHSEMNAIIHADYSDMQGATLYLCGFENGNAISDPDCCNLCKRMIINSGINRIVFGNDVGIVRVVIPGEWKDELEYGRNMETNNMD